ncbi:hypothetical protein GYMLUDRAFT_94488 [Collybiopsis luxurians FD-317 M1]|nr:hypothetical protein GYMLUDRAFT_94488 [Collybiopsis luxurians FD-317 M1]
MTSPIVIFDILQSLALISLLIPFTTAALSKSVSRMKTWYNLLFFFIVYCISYLLLIGHQFSKEEPPLALCTFQAGAIYAAPSGGAVAGFVFHIELYWRLSSALLGRRIRERNVFWLLFLTPIIHGITFWSVIFYGLSDATLIQRENGIYCHIESKLPSLFVGGTVITFVVLFTAVEIYTAHFLWKRRQAFHEVRQRLSQDIFPFSLFIRVIVYTLIGFIAVSITIPYLMPENTAEHLVSMQALAIIPLSVALLFGTQRDILQVYVGVFQRKKDATDGDALKPTNDQESR